MENEYSLRPIEEKDLHTVLTWRNSDHIRKYMYNDHIITSEEHLAWFQRLQETNNTIYLVFEWNGIPHGMVSFLDIDYKNKKCLWGFYLGIDNPKKGLGYTMGRLGITYAFENLGMRKICGEVFAFNDRSIGFHKKLGFVQEGYLKSHVFKEGNYQDIILFSLFKEEQ